MSNHYDLALRTGPVTLSRSIGEAGLADEHFRAAYESLDKRLSKQVGDDPTR